MSLSLYLGRPVPVCLYLASHRYRECCITHWKFLAELGWYWRDTGAYTDCFSTELGSDRSTGRDTDRQAETDTILRVYLLAAMCALPRHAILLQSYSSIVFQLRDRTFYDILCTYSRVGVWQMGRSNENSEQEGRPRDDRGTRVRVQYSNTLKSSGRQRMNGNHALCSIPFVGWLLVVALDGGGEQFCFISVL